MSRSKDRVLLLLTMMSLLSLKKDLWRTRRTSIPTKVSTVKEEVLTTLEAETSETEGEALEGLTTLDSTTKTCTLRLLSLQTTHQEAEVSNHQEDEEIKKEFSEEETEENSQTEVEVVSLTEEGSQIQEAVILAEEEAEALSVRTTTRVSTQEAQIEVAISEATSMTTGTLFTTETIDRKRLLLLRLLTSVSRKKSISVSLTSSQTCRRNLTLRSLLSSTRSSTSTSRLSLLNKNARQVKFAVRSSRRSWTWTSQLSQLSKPPKISWPRSTLTSSLLDLKPSVTIWSLQTRLRKRSSRSLKSSSKSSRRKKSNKKTRFLTNLCLWQVRVHLLLNKFVLQTVTQFRKSKVRTVRSSSELSKAKKSTTRKWFSTWTSLWKDLLKLLNHLL